MESCSQKTEQQNWQDTRMVAVLLEILKYKKVFSLNPDL